MSMAAILRRCYTNSEILRYDPEAYLKPSRTDTTELFCENSSWLFSRLSVFELVLNTPL